MICIATDGAKRTCQPRLLAQALRISSDFLICTQGKSSGTELCLRRMEMGQGAAASAPDPLKAVAGIKAATLIVCPF
jgi:hypothetical protein